MIEGTDYVYDWGAFDESMKLDYLQYSSLVFKTVDGIKYKKVARFINSEFDGIVQDASNLLKVFRPIKYSRSKISVIN